VKLSRAAQLSLVGGLSPSYGLARKLCHLQPAPDSRSQIWVLQGLVGTVQEEEEEAEGLSCPEY